MKGVVWKVSAVPPSFHLLQAKVGLPHLQEYFLSCPWDQHLVVSAKLAKQRGWLIKLARLDFSTYNQVRWPLPATFPRPSSAPGAADPDGQESKLDLKACVSYPWISRVIRVAFGLFWLAINSYW